MGSIKIHEKQAQALNSGARFTVFAAGRRSGKTYLAALWLLKQAMAPEREGVTYGPTARVLYVAPTIGMARDLMEDLFMDVADEWIKGYSVQRMEFTMTNGRKVKLAGCDKPRSLRGGSIIALALDEVQDIDINEVWNRVLRPACGDLRAPVLFIGTPLPGTAEEWHDLYRKGMDKGNRQWASIHCNSTDNPFIDMQAEVDQARSDGVSEKIIQAEFYASFDMTTASQFDVDMPEYEESEVPTDSLTYIAVDLMGFADTSGMSMAEIKRLDEAAIAVVTVDARNHWWVRTIIHGRWGVDETAEKIIQAAKQYRPAKLGIEKGVLKNALDNALKLACSNHGVFPNIVALSHGGKSKVDRVFWALQGRLENKFIHVPRGRPEWVQELTKQLLMFPAPHGHDDLADGLAYIDQLADKVVLQDAFDKWEHDSSEAYYETLDEEVGF